MSFSFELSGRSVHVWPILIDPESAVAVPFSLLLAADERDRAASFRFDHLRHSFTLARGALRILLGCYLNIPPAEIQFIYGSKGKPALTGATPLAFNTSHSGSLAVFAFATGCELGVDVEEIREFSGIDNIADHFFCPEEAAELRSLSGNERTRAFFTCWTRKEAYIKAIGEGVSAPLDTFRVTLQPNQPAGFLHLGHDRNAAAAWTLHDLQFAPHYAAALAYPDAERPVVVFPPMNAAELLKLPSIPARN